jgi:hypothetical protein
MKGGPFEIMVWRGSTLPMRFGCAKQLDWWPNPAIAKPKFTAQVADTAQYFSNPGD